MNHIIVPEGLARPDGAGQALSVHYAACLRQVAAVAVCGEDVYLAPGNAFGQDRPEDEVAADVMQRLRPDLTIHRIELSRRGYLDTLDNAHCLRAWAERNGRWPLGASALYCTRYHAVRAWLCFRATGYGVHRTVGCSPDEHRSSIVRRLAYYDYPVLHVVYEAGAICYTALRLVALKVASAWSGLPPRG